MRRIVLQLVFFFSALSALFASAQAPLASDLRLMTQGDVYAVATQADGKVILGGDFTRVAGVARRNLARLNTNGSLDLAWNPSPDGVVRAIAIDGSNVFVGGQFANIGGAARANLARLDASGNALAFSAATNGAVLSLLVDGSGLFVGGDFTTAGGQARTRLASIDIASGTLNPFAPAPNGAVRALAVLGANLYFGGSFTQVGTTTRNRLAAAEKAAGALAPWNPNLNGDVYALAPDGSNLYVGGEFTAVGAMTRNRGAALEATTAALHPWDPNANGNIYAMRIDGSLVYLGGLFSAAGTQPRSNLAAVSKSVGAAQAWNPGASSTVRALARGPGRSYVGGAFDTAAGATRIAFAAIDDTGANVSGWSHAGRAGVVNAVAAQPDGRVLVGGNFLVAHDAGGTAQTRTYLLRLNVDGSLDSTWTSGTNYIIQSIAVLGSDAYVGGSFSRAGGLVRSRLAAFDVNTGAVKAWNPGANGNVIALLAADGTIYVGGEFTTAGGQSRSRLAAFDAAGATLSWNPGANAAVAALAFDDGAVIVGGYFSVVGGSARASLAAVAGALGSNSGTLLPFDPQPNGPVLSLYAIADTIYAGGPFSTIGGATRNGLAAVNLSNSVATPWNPIAGQVAAIGRGGSLLYAGGSFSTLGGQARLNLGAVDVSTAAADPWNPTANGDIRALAVRNSLVFAGGTFTQVGGIARDGLVILPAASAGSSLLSIAKVGSGTVTGTGINCGADCEEETADGNLVTLAAAPQPGWVFTGWSGPCSGTGTCSFLMNGPVTVAATFRDHFTVSANAMAPNGGGGRAVSSPAGIDCGSDCFEDFAPGSVVTFNGVPDGVSLFSGWSGVCAFAGTNPCTLTLTSDVTVTASFARGALLTVDNAGTGTVTSNPAGINCGATCSKVFTAGAAVTLTATPAPGGSFLGWGGGTCSGTAPSCMLTMNADTVVTAAFGVGPILTVGLSGGGTVSSSPAGIACPGDCTESYPLGTVVTLTPTPDALQSFMGWNGSCAGTGPCTVTMSAARNVIATFEPTRILLIGKTGDGTGRVRSSPAGIDCGTDCSEDYTASTLPSVTLTAEPDNKSFLLFWTSPCAFDSLTCSVNVAAPISRTITAFFAANRVQVQINGRGRVTAPAINCPGDCQEVVNVGTTITLTATPQSGAGFSGWGGACSGTAATCTVTVDRGASVVANFVTGDLYVGVQGGGRVVSTPAGIDCRDPECYFQFPYGTQVTLQATPDAGMRFDRWENDCTGTSPACTLTLDASSEAHSAVAIFTAAKRSDFDGNGKSDLVWRNNDGGVAVWLMDGLTPASSAQIFPAGTAWQVAHIADLNGDGKSDLVWQNPDGRITVYLMDGTTAATKQLILPAGGGWTVTQAADLDGDGKADLIFQNTDGTIAAWLMDGVSMKSGSTLLTAGSGWSVTKTGDFDGDGKADLLWTHADGRVAIWLMDGLAVKSTNQILNAGTGWSVAHVADFDGDGKADLLWQNTDGSIALWLMNGAAMSSGSGLLGAGSGWSVTRTGDFNGDGKADLFFLHADGRAAIYLMNGLTPTQTTQILNAGGGWSAKRVQDMNGDGKADIVWENIDGRVAVWLMNGAMTSGSEIMGPATGWTVSGVSP